MMMMVLTMGGERLSEAISCARVTAVIPKRSLRLKSGSQESHPRAPPRDDDADDVDDDEDEDEEVENDVKGGEVK